MAIHNQLEKSMSGGVQKKIEGSAMNLILDNLQKYQYKYAIKSTVRELICNGVDSITEKEVARNILTGIKQVSDYFESREGEEYQDSNFDPSYYDLNWLSDDNSVYLTYIVGSDIEKDKVIITDNGVGLGSYRLEKYFSLGYSTKRLSKLPLGKFGIGGKAPLSIGVDYFTMESRYNGRLYRFNIYSHTIDSIIPEWNLVTGVQNQFVLFNEGTKEEYKVYYENTTEKNGIVITIDAKKTHKQQYTDAVKSQLLYFPNIKFAVHEEGKTYDISYQAEILYEDDLIILSDNKYWDKPHLLLNKVNYGYIDFDELELESKTGNIGIKIAPEEVDVNPSRESIIWNDKTKETILNRFNQVVDIASVLITEELKTVDYINWIRACFSLTGKRFSSQSIVGRLARIVNLNDIKPSFIPDPRLKFQQTKILNGLYVRQVKIDVKLVAGRNKYQVMRKELKTVTDVIMQPIYLMKFGEKASNRKDKWLYAQHQNMGGFLIIMEPVVTRDAMLNSGMTEEHAQLMLAFLNKEGEEIKFIISLTWDFIMKSSEHLGWYEDIKVPDDFKATDEEVDEEDTAALVAEREKKKRSEKDEEERKERMRIANLSTKERRKLEGRTLIYTPRVAHVGLDSSKKYDEAGNEISLKLYDWQKIEIPIKDMNDWDAEEIYYGIGPGTDELLHFTALLTRDPAVSNKPGNPIRGCAIIGNNGSKIRYNVSRWDNGRFRKLIVHHKVNDLENAFDCQQFYDNKEIMLVKASIANAKYMRDFQPIEQFFSLVRNKVLTMSNVLIRWNTARLIKEQLDQAAFLHNFDSFNSRFTNYYHKLQDYVQKNFRSMDINSARSFFGFSKETYDDLIKHLDKVKQFQDFVATNPTNEEVSDMAQYMFGNKQLQDAQAVDPEMMHILQKVIDFSDAVGIMFNHIPLLTSGGKIPGQLEMEIKQYLEMKGLLDYGKEEEELQEFLQLAENSGVMLVETPDHYVMEQGEVIPYTHTKDVVQVLHPEVHHSDDLEIPPDQSIYQEF
jgi:hypothetical protein